MATSDTNLRCPLPAFPAGTIVNINLALEMHSFANVATITYDGVPSFPVEEHQIVTGIAQILVINVSNIVIRI